MKILLQGMDDTFVAFVQITKDDHGYVYAEHPTFQFECEIALYGYQNGVMVGEPIEDIDCVAYMKWAICKHYRTEDGYNFYVMPNGRVTGHPDPELEDLAWDSFEDFMRDTEYSATEITL
jgi:hypothetical protein